MKRSLWGLFVLLLMLYAAPALSQEAKDITPSCALTPSVNRRHIRLMHDGKFTTSWGTAKTLEAELAIMLPEESGAYGIYICWGNMPDAWTLEAEDGAWDKVHTDTREGFAHAYIPLNGQKQLRLIMENREERSISIHELYVFSNGEIPDWVQRWQPTVEKADLMVLVAHPDDEHLYMGGTLPYYAGQLQKNVLVAYMTCANVRRRSELLNGLWTVGLTHYPVIGNFPDRRHDSLEEMYALWGREKTQRFVVDLYRKYQPQVVVSHDIRGEYGHGAHRLCAAVSQFALEASSDPAQYPESATLYGVWDVPKLYLHLYRENSIKMDWRKPLSAFQGKTAFDMASLGYAQHVTQQEYAFRVKDSGAYNCAKFGLVRSLVGPDEAGNDFFEHISAK